MELHGVAHIDVEQVVADQAGRDLGGAPRRISPVLLVADLHLEQVVAGGRRVVDAKVALAERVQQAHAHEPVVVAPIGAAADAHWRHARDVAAVGERGAHEVVLAVDAEDSGRHREQVPLPGHLAAAEDGVALGIDGLDELGAGSATGEILAAQNAGGLPEDEVVVFRIVDLGVEAERAVGALEADLGGVGGLDLQAGIADLERGG